MLNLMVWLVDYASFGLIRWKLRSLKPTKTLFIQSAGLEIMVTVGIVLLFMVTHSSMIENCSGVELEPSTIIKIPHGCVLVISMKLLTRMKRLVYILMALTRSLSLKNFYMMPALWIWM